MTEIKSFNFDLLANDYNNYHYAHNNFLQIIKEHVAINKDKTIIDLGCGTGNETINFYRFFKCKVIGIEPSEKMVSIGREQEPKVDWKVGTAENIPLKDNSIDIITSFFSIHHFNSIDSSFQEFSRILVPKGKIFIFSISHSQMQSSLEYKFFPELLYADLSRVPSISSLKENLALHNFAIRTTETEYETRNIDEKYLEMVKNQYRSGLRLLNQEQLNLGIKRVEESIDNDETLVDRINCTVLIAQKQ